MGASCCPTVYSIRSGDLPGWGTDLGSRLSLTRQECVDKCTEKNECLSFEHRTSTNQCNLNRIAEPTQGAYRDFAFCVKQIGMLY